MREATPFAQGYLSHQYPRCSALSLSMGTLPYFPWQCYKYLFHATFCPLTVTFSLEAHRWPPRQTTTPFALDAALVLVFHSGIVGKNMKHIHRRSIFNLTETHVVSVSSRLARSVLNLQTHTIITRRSKRSTSSAVPTKTCRPATSPLAPSRVSRRSCGGTCTRRTSGGGGCEVETETHARKQSRQVYCYGFCWCGGRSADGGMKDCYVEGGGGLE